MKAVLLFSPAIGTWRRGRIGITYEGDGAPSQDACSMREQASDFYFGGSRTGKEEIT